MDPVASLRRIIEHVTRDRIYMVKFDAVVERQHDDGSVDVLPDDERMRGTGLSQVPIRHGLPGVTVKVKVGSRCLLGFANGDPRKPYVSCWDPTSIEEISFDGGQAPVARMGDAVTVFWPSTVPLAGVISPPPPTGAFAGALTIGTPSVGMIKTGAARVKA